jgi:peptidoglycan/LPS O-acetylase OafA/YrhL
VRQEIQGLRAIAVLLVVLFHLWPHRLPGGYVGVDVFFVISGFLITSHLLREVDREGSVDLGRFWARRIRRLLPASYLVLLVSAVGVLLWVPRLLWQQFFGEILAAALYVENWALAISSVDYLAADNSPSPAQHYWTLSAEEQFYLLWPLLVLLGLWWARRRASAERLSAPRLSTTGASSTIGARRAVLGVLAAATAASLAYSLWVTATNPAWAYFVTPARAWQFGAGALLAFAPSPQRLRLTARARGLLGWAGLVVLLSSAVVFDESTPFPGTAALWVVASSVVLIWVGAPQVAWSHARLLVLRPARFVGDISYSIYLWHWPLIILLPFVTDHPLTRTDRIGILVATIALSAATKRWVEDPVRRARHLGLARTRTTFAYAVAGAVVLTAVCVVPRHEVARQIEDTERVAARLAADAPRCFGAASRDPEITGCPNPALADQVVPSPAAAGRDYPAYGRCNAPLLATPLRPCRFGERKEGVPHVAVIGDSHARVLMTMVEQLVDEGRLTADMLVMGNCAWSTAPTLPSPVGERCREFRRKLTPLLDRTATDYDAVLTTARLTTLIGGPARQTRGLAQAWGRVARQGVPVLVLRDNPQERDSDLDPNLCLAKVTPARANEECSLDRSERLEHWYDALSAAARRTPGAEVIDLTPFLCDEETCPVVVGGVNVYVDNNHLTVTYARTLAPYLYRALVARGVLTS